jgi:hypothetical protein
LVDPADFDRERIKAPAAIGVHLQAMEPME